MDSAILSGTLCIPQRKLYEIRGTQRINLTVRLFAVFVAINLIPFLAILVSLYRVALSNRNPVDSLQMLTSGLWVIIPVVVAIGGGLVFIISLNLTKSLDAMVVVLKQAKQIIEAIVFALDRFQKDSAAEDDITLVFVKIEQD